MHNGCLDTSPGELETTLEELQRRLEGLWEPPEALREAMRQDLGLDEPYASGRHDT
jgi:hypothetical protein